VVRFKKVKARQTEPFQKKKTASSFKRGELGGGGVVCQYLKESHTENHYGTFGSKREKGEVVGGKKRLFFLFSSGGGGHYPLAGANVRKKENWNGEND